MDFIHGFGESSALTVQTCMLPPWPYSTVHNRVRTTWHLVKSVQSYGAKTSAPEVGAKTVFRESARETTLEIQQGVAF